jgi:hypothetical protein
MIDNDNIALSGQWLVGSLLHTAASLPSLRKPPTNHRRKCVFVKGYLKKNETDRITNYEKSLLLQVIIINREQINEK